MGGQDVFPDAVADVGVLREDPELAVVPEVAGACLFSCLFPRSSVVVCALLTVGCRVVRSLRCCESLECEGAGYEY